MIIHSVSNTCGNTISNIKTTTTWSDFAFSVYISNRENELRGIKKEI